MLPDSVGPRRRPVAKGELELGKARALVGLPERVQLDLAQRIAREGLTTRQVEALAKAGKPGGSPSPAGAGTAPEPLAPDPDRARLEADLEILEGVLERLGYRS